jgi:hypothetical protein
MKLIRKLKDIKPPRHRSIGGSLAYDLKRGKFANMEKEKPDISGIPAVARGIEREEGILRLVCNDCTRGGYGLYYYGESDTFSYGDIILVYHLDAHTDDTVIEVKTSKNARTFTGWLPKYNAQVEWYMWLTEHENHVVILELQSPEGTYSEEMKILENSTHVESVEAWGEEEQFIYLIQLKTEEDLGEMWTELLHKYDEWRKNEDSND